MAKMNKSKSKNNEPASLISDDVKEYISLRIKRLKLTAVENLSTFTSGVFGVFVFLLVLFISLLLLSFGAAFWLGDVLGSMALAFAIVGGAVGVVAVVMYALRNRLIADSMVRKFSQMFFSTNLNSDQDE